MTAVKEMLDGLEPSVLNAPRYIIGSTSAGSVQLQANPDDPLPTSEMVFLSCDEMVRIWLMANLAPNPLDLLVVERP